MKKKYDEKRKRVVRLPSPARRVAWENPSLRYCWPVCCITAKACVWRLWTVTTRSTASRRCVPVITQSVEKSEYLQRLLCEQFERTGKKAYPVLTSGPGKVLETAGRLEDSSVDCFLRPARYRELRRVSWKPSSTWTTSLPPSSRTAW